MRKVHALSLCFLLIGLVALGDWGPERVLPAAAQGTEEQEVDERATRLRKRLGPYCRNFDFFYRHSFARGMMRPVRCSRAGRVRTVVLAFAFSDRDTKDAWLGEWGRIAKERGAPVISGGRWTVEVLVRKHAKEIRRRLRD